MLMSATATTKSPLGIHDCRVLCCFLSFGDRDSTVSSPTSMNLGYYSSSSKIITNVILICNCSSGPDFRDQMYAKLTLNPLLQCLQSEFQDLSLPIQQSRNSVIVSNAIGHRWESVHSITSRIPSLCLFRLLQNGTINSLISGMFEPCRGLKTWCLRVSKLQVTLSRRNTYSRIVL